MNKIIEEAKGYATIEHPGEDEQEKRDIFTAGFLLGYEIRERLAILERTE